MSTAKRENSAPTKKLYMGLVKKLQNELKTKKSIGRCKVEICWNDDEEDMGAYINVCYRASKYFDQGFDFGSQHPDNIVTRAMKRVIGKYFTESGSGCGFGGRDIGFAEKSHMCKRRQKSEAA